MTDGHGGQPEACERGGHPRGRWSRQTVAARNASSRAAGTATTARPRRTRSAATTTRLPRGLGR
jgi:hypothetical protein